MKIYTKSGDKGLTSLIGGQRVSKTDPRVEAYGTVDELSAQTAMLRDLLSPDGIGELIKVAGFRDDLIDILRTLMAVEASLASAKDIGSGTSVAVNVTGNGRDTEDAPTAGETNDITPAQIKDIESKIDALSAEVRPISHFTIPGGHIIVSQCHICRTVCRRAEREAYRVAQVADVPSNALTYLNRLSDYFYILGRRLSELLDAEEIIWIP